MARVRHPAFGTIYTVPDADLDAWLTSGWLREGEESRDPEPEAGNSTGPHLHIEPQPDVLDGNDDEE